MSYQTLPWQYGNSRSFEKLLALCLPSLKGKSLLDVGCNTGYFCAWAAFEKAARVMGIDHDAEAIELAKSWFPECSFSRMEWEDLPPDRYDIVLCLSAIHYADDQKALLDLLMERVAADGMLVLEMGVAPGEGDGFETVRRSIDVRRFPTRKTVHAMLADYVFKPFGESVQQAGDPVPRHVYHVYHKLPVAALLMSEPYSGKTSVAETLFRPELPYVSGDVVYSRVVSGDLEASECLREHIRPEPDSRRLNSAAVTMDICKAGLLPELAALFTSFAGGRDVVIDNYIPAAYRDAMCEAVRKTGYFPVAMSVWEPAERPWTRQYPPRSHYKAFSKYLEKMGLVDETAYLEANPDVARAVTEKKMPNAQYHYYHFGRREGRKLRK